MTVPNPDVFWYRLTGMGVQKYKPKNVFLICFDNVVKIQNNWENKFST